MLQGAPRHPNGHIWCTDDNPRSQAPQLPFLTTRWCSRGVRRRAEQYVQADGHARDFQATKEARRYFVGFNSHRRCSVYAEQRRFGAGDSQPVSPLLWCRFDTKSSWLRSHHLDKACRSSRQLTVPSVRSRCQRHASTALKQALTAAGGPNFPNPIAG